MSRFDAIVVGLGAMGGAALSSLAARGARALGIERHAIAHAMGSSHGKSRVIRTAYFEHPAYVPLLVEAFGRWRALESSTGRALLAMTGAVHVGPREHEGITGVIAADELHSLGCERLEAADIRSRFPALVPGPGDCGVFEPDAGVLAVEACIDAQVVQARNRGAQVRANASVDAIVPGKREVRVQIAGGDELVCDTLVLATGAWMADGALIDPPCPLQVERQVQCWFEPSDPELVSSPRLPVFVHFRSDRAYYGIPRDDDSGIKVCRHYGGAITTADELDRRVGDADEQDVRSYLRAHLPVADGPLLDARVCMYTNTPDKHFAIGRHPDYPRVVVAGGFSGHGFKLAPVVGEIVADLVVDGETSRDISLFSPGRFGG